MSWTSTGTGQGNTVTLEQLLLKLGYQIEKLTTEVLKSLALQFITAHADILNISIAEIVEEVLHIVAPRELQE